MRLLKVSEERTAALSLVTMMLFVTTIGKENGALESYADNDNNLPVDELTNIDEDDEKDFNFPFSEEISTYTTNTSAATKKQEKCYVDQIMLYLAEIQVINPETIVQIASYKDFEPVCRFLVLSISPVPNFSDPIDLLDKRRELLTAELPGAVGCCRLLSERSIVNVGATLESIDAWMLTCDPLPANNLYMRLTAGVRTLENKLCARSDYQLAFKKYMECYQELHDEYIDCTGPADWIEDMEGQELCNQYKVIADCYYTQTAMLCGVKAAKTLKELVVGVINSIIEIDCPEVRKNPLVPDPMPDHGVYTRKSSSNKIQAIYTIIVVAILLICRY